MTSVGRAFRFHAGSLAFGSLLLAIVIFKEKIKNYIFINQWNIQIVSNISIGIIYQDNIRICWKISQSN